MHVGSLEIKLIVNHDIKVELNLLLNKIFVRCIIQSDKGKNNFTTGREAAVDLNFRAGSTFPVPGLAGATRLTRSDCMLPIG